MAVATIDNKKRLTLKEAKPGEVYDVEYIGAGHFRLRRMKREPEPNHSNPSDGEEPCCSNCGGNHTESDCRESVED